jgi:hypothetical protein
MALARMRWREEAEGTTRLAGAGSLCVSQYHGVEQLVSLDERAMLDVKRLEGTPDGAGDNGGLRRGNGLGHGIYS